MKRRSLPNSVGWGASDFPFTLPIGFFRPGPFGTAETLEFPLELWHVIDERVNIHPPISIILQRITIEETTALIHSVVSLFAPMDLSGASDKSVIQLVASH
jgi:hypothetical protein